MCQSVEYAFSSSSCRNASVFTILAKCTVEVWIDASL